MQKIISLFQRNYDGDHLVRDEVVPGAEWVLAGEGMATQKIDGACCMMNAGKLFKRYDAKAGKTPPSNFVPAQPEADPVTGHWPGWVPVGDAPDDRWLNEALKASAPLPDGTYELIGPKVQGNPEQSAAHCLIKHGAWVMLDKGLHYMQPRSTFEMPPRTFSELREWFKGKDLEGIVWHHPDGRMVKVKKKDFGMKRKD